MTSVSTYVCAIERGDHHAFKLTSFCLMTDIWLWLMFAKTLNNLKRLTSQLLFCLFQQLPLSKHHIDFNFNHNCVTMWWNTWIEFQWGRGKLLHANFHQYLCIYFRSLCWCLQSFVKPIFASCSSAAVTLSLISSNIITLVTSKYSAKWCLEQKNVEHIDTQRRVSLELVTGQRALNVKVRLHGLYKSYFKLACPLCSQIHLSTPLQIIWDSHTRLTQTLL